LIIVLIV